MEELPITTLADAKSGLLGTLSKFEILLKKVNGWNINDYTHPSLLPDATFNSIDNFKNALTDSKFLEIVKDDFKGTATKGKIQFKALTALATENLESATDPTAKKYKPIKLIEYPPKDVQSANWGWGAALLMDIAAFSLEYDFETDLDYFLLKLNDAKIALDIRSTDPADQQMKTVYTTPYLPMTVEIKIPRSLNLSVNFPAITFRLIGLGIDFDPNFPLSLPDFLNFKPLHLVLPDWLQWPFGPIDFGFLFDFQFDTQWAIGLFSPNSGKFKLPNINWDKIRDIFLKLIGLFGFSWSGSKIDYFTYTTPPKDVPIVPEWAAIYFDLTGVCKKILGGLSPTQLHLLIGFNSNEQQVKAGFLICTDPIGTFENKPLMLQAAAYYDFDVKTEPEFDIEHHPGFSIDVLTDTALGAKVGCPNPAEARVKFGGFWVEASKIGIQYEKTEKAYAFYIDGKFTVKEFLKNADKTTTDTDLTLPFKGLGITTDGKLVLKKSWIDLEKAQQVKIDDIEQISLFLKGYGYGKEKTGEFTIGFSGDIRLPVLNASAGVERLIIKSDGSYELSGVNLNLDIAKILMMAGSLAWGPGLNAPLAGTNVSGFAGRLALSIPIINLPKAALGLTYVKCQLDSAELIAWSFYGEIPVRIPICCGLGINSLGMMVGQNYLPLPKKRGIPTERWLEEGYNGDVDNILNVVNYWTVSPDVFSLGFSVGIATLADNGFIINGRAILIIVSGPIVMIAGKANILSKASSGKSGAFDLLIVYDQDDPGILTSLAFNYDVKKLVAIKGMAEIYFSFTDAGSWHFYLGTHEKPVNAKVLSIFDAKAWLTIDANKLATGAAVYFGKSWSWGPLYVKAYISFETGITISWNPAYVEAMIALEGAIAAKVFGFGFDISLAADLLAKAPNPWYLYASATAKFTIDLFFFSWSFTAHLEFSWGDDVGTVSVKLTSIYDENNLFKALTNSLRSYSSLTPKPNSQARLNLPMDGVLSLQFARDIDIDQNTADFPSLDGLTPVGINDEESKHAADFQRFHAKLTDLKITKETTPGIFLPFPEDIYFAWTPEDSKERQKLIVRDFDKGYSKFRLNDDPNAYVKLYCPDIYQTLNMLYLHAEVSPKFPEGQNSFAVDSPLNLNSDPNYIAVKPTKDQTDENKYLLNYPDFTAKLSSDGIVPIQKGTPINFSVRTGDELEFKMPAACVTFLFKPDQMPLNPNDFTLLDEYDQDFTSECLNNILQTPDGFIVMLNDFDNTNVYPKMFSYQLPPKCGIKRLIFKKQGILLPFGSSQGSAVIALKPGGNELSLYPLEALREVHTRNLELLEQQAKLEYVFGQNADPKKILWEVGAYKIDGKTVWQTNNGEREPSNFNLDFNVTNPFEKIEVELEDGKAEIQPFDPYVRRFTPINGARPFYRDQNPAVAYRCNYINAMIKKAGKKLSMILVDSNNNPCRYTQLIITFIQIKDSLKPDIAKILQRTKTKAYKRITEYEEGLPTLVPGLTSDAVEKAYGRGWKSLLRRSQLPKKKTKTQPPSITVSVIDRNTLLKHATELRIERTSKTAKQPRKRLSQTEKILNREFTSEKDQAFLIQVADVILVAHITYKTGVVEYRYTNDDLALDLTSLNLSDCLNPGQPQALNAYERGYFTPIIPQGAFWNGPAQNTSYTAKIYCLNETDELGDALPNTPELYSTSFAASMLKSPSELSDLFAKSKIRDLFTDTYAYDFALSTLETETTQSPFSHPDNPTIALHLGMDLFRALNSTPTIDPTELTPRELEEKHQQLMDDSKTAINKERTEEQLRLESLLEGLNLTLDPLSPKRILITWLRTANDQGNPEGTIGVMADFPEPIDWDRTGIRIKTFKIQITDEPNELDLLNPPTGNPSYDITFHWLRSLDGTRLILIPEIIETGFVLSELVVSPTRIKTAAISEFAKKEGPKMAKHDSERLAEAYRQPTETKPTPTGASYFGSKIRMGDYTMASTMGITTSQLIKEIGKRFGRKTVAKISRYEVTDLELEFYYFSDNYETKNSNYRGIPRLTFRTGKPGDTFGKIGTLNPISKGGAP